MQPVAADRHEVVVGQSPLSLVSRRVKYALQPGTKVIWGLREMEFSVGIGAFVLPPDGIIHQVRKGDMAPTLREIGVGFVSLHEALDFTSPTGRALAGMLAVFAEFEREILRERVKAGIGKPGDAGSGTGGRRLSRITPRPCGNSLPQASVKRRLPNAWGAVAPGCGASCEGDYQA
jgi:hypothetical protein